MATRAILCPGCAAEVERVERPWLVEQRARPTTLFWVMLASRK
jgi:hypothetical protein